MNCYRIHDLLQGAVDGSGPDAEVFLAWLREFPTREGATDPADLTWSPEPSHDAHLSTNPVYDIPRQAGPRPVGRLTRDGRWECFGPSHNPLLVIQDLLLARDTSLVHACALEFQGKGVVVFGESGSGKTVVALSALRDGRVRLLSDDLAIVRPDGEILAFPTPVAVYPIHFPLLPPNVHTSLRRRKLDSRLLHVFSRLPLGRRIGRLVRDRLIAREGTESTWARSVNTQYLSIPTRRLVPADRMTDYARAGLCLFLDPHGKPWRVEALQSDEALSLLSATTYKNQEMALPCRRTAWWGHST